MSKTCLFQIGERYLSWLQFGRFLPVTEQSLLTAKRNLKAITEYLENCEIEHIKQTSVSDLRRIMLGKGNAFGTIRKILIQLRSLLTYAKEEEKLNVLSSKEIKLPPVERKIIEYLSFDQLREFVLVFEPQDILTIRMAAITLIFLDSGMRLSEVLSLNRDSINFKTGEATITGKGRKKRVVFFHSWSIKAIKKYLKLRCDDNPALFVNHHHHQGVKRCTSRWVDKYFRGVSKKLGFRICPHILRKTAATVYYKNSKDVNGTRLYMGHTLIATTLQFYIGEDIGEQKKAHKQHVYYRGIVEKVSSMIGV